MKISSIEALARTPEVGRRLFTVDNLAFLCDPVQLESKATSESHFIDWVRRDDRDRFGMHVLSGSQARTFHTFFFAARSVSTPFGVFCGADSFLGQVGVYRSIEVVAQRAFI